MNANEGKAGAQDIAAQLVDVLRSIFGKHRARTVHAKGVILEGNFTPAAEARSLSIAPLFAGASLQTVVRFSDSTGLPDISDADANANPRGLAIKLRLPNGSDTDVVAHSFNGFPAATADEFLQLLRAIASSGPAAAKPTALDKFLASHPPAVQFLTKQKPAPVSWATLTYFGVNSFRFIDGSAKGTHLRYRFVPQAGEQLLDAKSIASTGPNYLSEEIAKRLQAGPIIFDWLGQLAESSDVIDDPSVAWPEQRKLVKLGTVSIVRMNSDQALADRETVFAPGNLPAGIEAADPMVAIRDAAYSVSYHARQ